jgi:hypothetical protein
MARVRHGRSARASILNVVQSVREVVQSIRYAVRVLQVVVEYVLDVF